MGGNQLGFSDYEQTTTKKQAKSAKFLSKMEMVVPCDALITLAEPHYPKTSRKGERPPHPLGTMLWIHLLQQLYSLNDPAMEEALIEEPTMGRFAGIDLSSDDLSSDRIPDETTILSVRHQLEKHMLGERIFKTVKLHPPSRGGLRAAELGLWASPGGWPAWSGGCLSHESEVPDVGGPELSDSSHLPQTGDRPCGPW